VSGRRLVGTFWPSRRERLLLLTALAEPDRALAAWLELRRDFELQTTEDLAFGALPLIFQRLQAAGVDDPDLARLKGIYRSTWAKNTLLVERLRATAEAFRAAEVPMVVIGSVGAALRYYETLGLRPTAEIDLLIREDDTTRAVRALGSAGWSTRGGARRGRTAPVPLFDEAGRLCLLRSSLAPDFVTDAGEPGETPLWDAATDLDANGTPVRVLSSTDDLLATLVAGARANPIHSVQWIVDAAMILRTPDGVDPERLRRIGVERGQGLRLRNALEYLQGLLGSVPLPTVQEQLVQWKPSARERLSYWCTSRSQVLAEHLGATAGRSAWATVATLPAFLRERWELDHVWQLPVAGGRRALRNVGRRRARPADPR